MVDLQHYKIYPNLIRLKRAVGCVWELVESVNIAAERGPMLSGSFELPHCLLVPKGPVKE